MMMKGKKKIFIISAIIVVLVVIIVMLLCITKKDDRKLIDQIFDIKDIDYEIIKVNNELDSHEYGGSYSADLKVKKENFHTFLDEVEKYYAQPENEEDYSIRIKNMCGKELGEGDFFYTRMGSVRREIMFVATPKTCMFYVVISPNEEGDYDVHLEYTE